MGYDYSAVMSANVNYLDEKTRWLQPPELTLLEPIKTAYPCGESGAIEAGKEFAR